MPCTFYRLKLFVGKCPLLIKKHKNLQNHKTLLTGSRDGDIRIWNINREAKVLEKSQSIPSAHSGWVWRIASEQTGEIFSCSFDHSLKYWNLSDEKLAEVWSLE
jgi:WD40 repeat protein